MPRKALEDNSRMSLRIRAEDKALLLRKPSGASGSYQNDERQYICERQ
jgi:hypothetical protein